MQGRSTKTLLGAKAREAVLKGVNSIYEPTRLTFGPEGKNALLYRTYNRGSRITNDGVTVADCQEPKDPHVNLAAKSFVEACKKTNQKVGDGTTATVIIGGKLFNDVYRHLTEKESAFTGKTSKGVMTLRREILESADNVKKAILKKATKIKLLEDLEHIAIVSVEDEELGKTIAKMAWEVGVDGFIDVVEGYKGKIETELIKGMRFPAKVPSKAFITNPERFEMVAEDTPVIVTNYALVNPSEMPFAEFNKRGVTKVIVVAPSFSENVLINMFNAWKSGYFIYPVATPSLREDQYKDLAIHCGANFINKNEGMKTRNITELDFGFLEKLVVKDTENKEDATAIGGIGEKKVEGEVSKVQERIEDLKGQLAETKQDQFKKLLERRIASMASAGGVIRVGDSTEASALYLKLKIEDGVYACKAALRGGYVRGGGICLKEIASKMKDDDILKQALLAPYEQIQSSVDGGIEIGPDIIDPAEGIYYAVEHATGVVANLATVEIITPEMPDPIHGEGEFAIASALNEMVINEKIKAGRMKENEVEMERDRLKGLTEDEHEMFDGEYLN
jgi:chaperonin GroEL